MTKGERIKNLRDALGMSQVSLADRISVSKQTLYKYENDIITNIPSDKVEEMAEVLGTTPAYIMGWNKPTTSKMALQFDEQKLLTNYRKLNDTGKAKAQEDVEDLTQIPKYTADITLVQAAHTRTDVDMPEGIDASDDTYFD